MSRSPEPLHFGNYQVLQRPDGSHWLLGEGGYGRTYKAEHRFLRRICALKIIHERFMRDERQRARFLQEAQTAARLAHRGIAHVYDFGEADGMFFYAMEFCEGGTLEELSKRLGPMAWPEVADFGGQVAEALACAHGAGLLHRDLKPQNVMLAAQERPFLAKLIDFGLVKVLKQSDTDSTWALMSREAGFKGNYATASPEQTGEEEELDERSDLFSLGVILWWLSIGHNPFEGSSNARVIADRLSPDSYEPRLPDNLDPRARVIVAKMLEKRPDDRFAHAAELLAALGEMYGGNAASSASTTMMSMPAPVAEAEAEAENESAELRQLNFEETFEVVATLDDLQVGKLYFCRDGADTHYSAMVLEHEIGRVCHDAVRGIGGARVLDCFEWVGEWRSESGQDVLVFGDLGKLRLLEVLKMLGGGRLVDLASMLGRLARCLDVSESEFGIELELNPHILRVAGPDHGTISEWVDLDPGSLRTVPRLVLGEEAAEVSADTTIVSGDADFPVSAQFPSLIYRMVSGIPVKHAAYFTSAAYVPVAALSEEGNRLLARLISSEDSWGGAAEFLSELAGLEGLPGDLFEPPVIERSVIEPPVAVAHVLAERGRIEREQEQRRERELAEQRVKEEAERKVREEAERRAREEDQHKAAAEAERRAKEEAERQAREAEEQREQRAAAERDAAAAAERRKKEAAERKQREAEERQRAKEEAELRAKEAAERKAREAEEKQRVKEEAARKAKETAERKALEKEEKQRVKEEAARKAKEVAESKAREKEERLRVKEEAARKAREVAERKALEKEEKQRVKEEAARKAREVAERKAREVAERKAKEAAERKVTEAAERKEPEKEAMRKVREVAAAAAARKAAERKQPKAEEKQEAHEEVQRRAREVAERKAREEEEERKARKRVAVEAEPEAVEQARPRAAKKQKETRTGKPAGRGRRKLGVLVGMIALLALAGAAVKYGPRILKPSKPVIDTPAAVAGYYPTLLGMADQLQPDDYRIVDREGQAAEWNEEYERWKFVREPAVPLQVVLRDGLVFENLWENHAGPVNQAAFPLDGVDLRKVRQVAGLELPALKRSAEAEAEEVRQEWLRVSAGAEAVPFRVEATAQGESRRVLWLVDLPTVAGAKGHDFEPRRAAEVAAVPMADNIEVVLLPPGYRVQRWRAGDAVATEIVLERAVLAAEIKAAPGGESGYGYDLLVMRAVDGRKASEDSGDGKAAADALPVWQPVRLTPEQLEAGHKLDLPSGRYELGFRGVGDESDDDLLARALVEVPGDCGSAGRIVVPGELPGIDIKVDGTLLDFRKLRFEPDGEIAAKPRQLVIEEAELVIGWKDLAIEVEKTLDEIDLWQVVEEFEGEAEILTHPVVHTVSFADSLLPDALLPPQMKIDLAGNADGSLAPLVIAAKFSGIYTSSKDKGLPCLPLPEDATEAAKIGFSFEPQPELPWWHNLRSYPNLSNFEKQFKERVKGSEFPGSTVYVECSIDLSGREPSRFFYCMNLIHVWLANWGTLSFPEEIKPGKGRAEFENVAFQASYNQANLTADTKLRFRAGRSGGVSVDHNEMLRKAADAGSVRPWWSMYQDWSKNPLEKADPSQSSGILDVVLTDDGGKPRLEIGRLREFHQPTADRWDAKVTELDPAARVEEVVREMGERYRGEFIFLLFAETQALTRTKALTPELWPKETRE